MGKSWWNDGGLSIHFTYFTYGHNVISYEFIYVDALNIGGALLSLPRVSERALTKPLQMILYQHPISNTTQAFAPFTSGLSPGRATTMIESVISTMLSGSGENMSKRPLKCRVRYLSSEALTNKVFLAGPNFERDEPHDTRRDGEGTQSESKSNTC